MQKKIETRIVNIDSERCVAIFDDCERLSYTESGGLISGQSILVKDWSGFILGIFPTSHFYAVQVSAEQQKNKTTN